MDNTLIVPIDIAALCVGKQDFGAGVDTFGSKDLAGIPADFTGLPESGATSGIYVSESALPLPFSAAGEVLGPGIHLHWALPDALTRGATSGGPVVFPQAPDRWLVVRIASSAAQANAVPSLNAWIVESDHLWRDADALPQNSLSRAVPLDPAGPQVWTLMGRAYPYAQWPGEVGPARQHPHTALGYGIPGFAAAYPHGPNVFGLYDDLDPATLPPGADTLSYVVLGWYADLSNDPLRTFTYPAGTTPPDRAKPGDKAALLQEHFRWSFDAGNALPDRIVCNGILRAVPWDPGRKYLQPRAADGVQVAIGNTTAEAVAALLQRACPDVRDLGTLLNYFQLGLLDRLKAPGGALDIDDTVHQAGFAHTPGGTIWVLKPKATETAGEQGAISSPADLPTQLAGLLNTLNSEQQALDALMAAIDARRAQVYFDWYRYMLLTYSSSTGDQSDPVATIGFIAEAEIPELSDLTVSGGTQDQQNAKVTAARAALDTALSQASGAFVVKSIGAPRYWQPAEPVVLVTGKDLQPPRRYGGDGSADPNGNVDNQGKLACRFSNQIVASMSVAAKATCTIGATDLPNLTSPAPGSVPGVAGPLLTEAFLVDPDRATLLGTIVARKSGADLPSSIDGLARAIGAAQQNLAQSGALQTGPVTFSGKAPSPVGLVTWSPPWIPLLLQWEVAVVPVQPAGGTSDYPPDLIAGKFRFDTDQIELDVAAMPSDQGSELVTYTGTAVLTGNSAINLQYQLDQYLAQYPNDPNAGVLRRIRETVNPAAMTQALSGFNQALLMRLQTLQLPVADPRASPQDLNASLSNTVVGPAVGSRNDVAPSPTAPFNPLRAGLLQLRRLRVIDCFGQWCDLPVDDVIVGGSLQPATPGDGTIALPARLAQPSRLLFRWVSADDDQVETNAHPATTPLFGWVLFNHLDDALMIYDPDGVALGSINSHGPAWQGAPGNDATYGKSAEAGLAGTNPLLRAFVLGICNRSGFADFLQDFLGAIDAAMATTTPAGYQEDQGLALLIGQPLALVRASLRLELEGLPALDQSWAAFDATLNAYQNGADASYSTRACAGITDVRFPVRLGEASRLDDGLIGYFIEGAYDTFHALAGGGSGSGVVQADPFAIQLAPVPATDRSRNLTLTMLVDPRGSVHATTGILPTKSIALPGDMYSAALRRIAVTFLTAPVMLTPALVAPAPSPAGARFPVRLPAESGYDWWWLTQDRDGWTAAQQEPAAGTKATFASPQRLVEGWLKLVRKP